MKRSTMSGLLAVLLASLGPALAGAADDDAPALVRRGIAAMGGEEKLNKAVKGMKYKAEGKLTLQGDDHDFTTETTIGGLDRIVSKFAGEFNGDSIEAVTVVDGAKGWRKFGGMTSDLEPDAVTNEKRNLYLVAVPATLVPLLAQPFRIEMAGDGKVGDRPVKTLKVTAPDGESFRLLLDAETGVPRKMLASVVGPGGDRYDQATTYLDYQEIGGIQKATKLEVTRDGDPFITAKIRGFEVVADVPAGTFTEPK